MQVFSEPEISQIESTNDVSAQPSGRRDSYEVSQIGDNTYATILPRNLPHAMASSSNEINGTIRSSRMPSNSGVSTIGNAEVADYATLRNVSRAPSAVRSHLPSLVRSRLIRFFSVFQLFEFTGSTFQALTQNSDGNYVAEIM